MAAALGLLACGIAQANPTGGVVSAGSASINTSPGSVIINQASNTAIINWQTFSIGAGEMTKFVQPNSSSAVLNRVTGGQESIINGTLSANGQVYLINGNGILVGPGGLVNTNGFTASTRDIADADFLSGNDHYTGSNSAGVQNFGTINALGGDVILIGKTVDNEGTITAPNGTVGLAAADDVLITQTGSQHVFVHATASATAAAGQTGITNGGTIAATNAELRAANGNIYALAINNAGTVRATTVTQQGGDIYLTADDGTVQNSGTLNASATVAKGQGGTVNLITGKNPGDLAVQTGSIISQGGQGGQGGNVEVSGGGIQIAGTVDLTASGGTTGSILIDPTTLTIVASGGTSDGSFTSSNGTETNNDTGTNDTIDASTVNTFLQTSNVTLQADTNITINAPITWTTSNTLTLQTGDPNGVGGMQININAEINAAPTVGNPLGGTLVIIAGNDTKSAIGYIIPTAPVEVGSFKLVLGFWQQIAGVGTIPSTLPDFSATQDFEVGESSLNPPIPGGGPRSTFERFAGGTGTTLAPFQITDVYGLQGLASTSNFFYPTNTNGHANYSFELVNNIDASATANWRQGDGFLPIGSNARTTSIGGTFNGNGFAIDGLTENYDFNLVPLFPNDQGNVGLFSYTIGSTVIKNLSLTNGVFSMANDVFGSFGALVATNNGTIENVSVSGSFQGLLEDAAGGLVGVNNSAGSITTSTASVNISITLDGKGSAVGGFVGDNEGSIDSSSSTGNVTILGQEMNAGGGEGNGVGIGGFVGYQDGTGSLTNAYATGNVMVTDLGFTSSFTDIPVGGFVGDFENGTIDSVYCIGLVTEFLSDPINDNPSQSGGIFAGLVNGSLGLAYARIDNNDSTINPGALGVLFSSSSTGTANELTGVSNPTGAILDSTTISFIDGVTWFQAPVAMGPTWGFPTLTAPPTPDTTTITLTVTGPNSGVSTYGDTVTFTSTVADMTNPGSTPTGTISFAQDDPNSGTLTILGTGTLALVGGVDQATWTTSVGNGNLLSAGDYSLVAVYNPTSGTMFGAADTTASPIALTVNQAALMITAGTATKVYGSTTLNYTGQQFTSSGLIAGTTDSVTGVTLTSDGQPAIAGVNGGTPYALVPSAAQGSGLSNYSITYTNGTVTVTPAPLVLTALPQTITQGGAVNTTPILNTTYSVTGLQNTDTLGGVLASGPTLSSSQSTATPGTFTGAIMISGTLNNTLGGNYALTLNNGDLTVHSATPDTTTISLSDNVGLTPTYGQAIILTATLSDTTAPGSTITGGTVTFDENGTMILSPVTVTGNTVTLDLPSLLNASGTAYDFTASYSGSTFFAASTTTAPLALTVQQAALLITAGTATKTYGTSTLTYTGGQQFTETGLVAGTGDSVTGVTLTSDGQATTAGVNGGTPYVITASAAQGTGLDNYAISYAPGSLTVDPAALTITGGAATKTYGSTALNFSGQPFTTSGLVTANGDTVTSVTFNSTGQAATAGVNGGTPYALTASAAQGTGLDNYTITYAPGGTVTVTPAQLTLAAANQTILVGGMINTTPILNTTYTVTGLQNTDQLASVLATGPTLSSTQDTSTAGLFTGAITMAGTLNNSFGGNYNLTRVNGDLTVQAAPPPPQNNIPGVTQLAALSQVGSTDGNANFNALFDQGNFPLTGDADDYVEIASASGEPSVQYYRHQAATSDEVEHIGGMAVLAHASSFNVGTP